MTVDGPHKAAQVAQVARALGVTGFDLLPWQYHAAAVLTQTRPDGRPRHRRIVISTPRRSGKTVLMSSVLTHRALSIPVSGTWYTAQTQTKAAEWWRKTYTNQLLKQSPALAGRFHTRLSAGSEAVTWPNGSTLSLFAPDGDKLHGEDVDLVVIDEAWKLTTDEGAQLVGAADPAGQLRPHYQRLVISTVGPTRSGWLADQLDSVTAVLYYGCPDSIDPYDPDQWHVWHPGFEHPDPMIRETLREAITADAEAMPRHEFLRAYANTPAGGATHPIPPDAWTAAQADPPERPTQVVVGFDTAWDRSAASVVLAWTADDVTWLELVEHREGTHWLIDYLTQRARDGRVLVSDPNGMARDIISALEHAYVPTQPLTFGDYAAACAELASGITDGRVRVVTDPVLDVAATATPTRRVGGRWAWDRATRPESAALSAATMAAWTAARTPRDPVLV